MKKHLKAILLVFITVAFAGCGEQKAPAIENGEFPWKLVYEMDGKRFTIEDTVVCEYSGISPMYFFIRRPRTWKESLKSGEEEKTVLLCAKNVESVLKKGRINERILLVLDYGMGAYYMGDPNSRSFIHAKPHLCYKERYKTDSRTTYNEGTELSEEDVEKYFGIKILEFEFSAPITNTFR